MFFAVDRNLIAKTVYFGYARRDGPIASTKQCLLLIGHFRHRLRSQEGGGAADAAGYPKKAGARDFTRLGGGRLVAENAKVAPSSSRG